MRKRPRRALPKAMIEPHLAPGERLLKAILAIHNPFTPRLVLAGPFGGFHARFFYMGLTDQFLHVVESDVFSNPIHHSEIKWSEVGAPSLRRGFTADYLSLDLPQYGRLTFQIPYLYKKDARHIVSILESRRQSPAA